MLNERAVGGNHAIRERLRSSGLASKSREIRNFGQSIP
jgi:hypothetical protein